MAPAPIVIVPAHKSKGTSFATFVAAQWLYACTRYAPIMDPPALSSYFLFFYMSCGRVYMIVYRAYKGTIILWPSLNHWSIMIEDASEWSSFPFPFSTGPTHIKWGPVEPQLAVKDQKLWKGKGHRHHFLSFLLFYGPWSKFLSISLIYEIHGPIK